MMSSLMESFAVEIQKEETHEYIDSIIKPIIRIAFIYLIKFNETKSIFMKQLLIKTD